MIDPRLSCRYTQARLTAFIHDELPLNARRYVARHLDNCPTCRAEFMAQKNTQQTLLREMPRIGQPTQPALTNIWARIETELVAQPTLTLRPRRKSAWMYGIAATLVVMMLAALPLALTSGAAHAALPEQPAPQTEISGKTHTPTSVAQIAQTEPVITATATPATLDNTPATPDAARSGNF